ncbi:MAG: anthranilate synthase component 1 [Deltaproteobacteria bacterium]|nr:anthranilate synthase component 1 [Deltaproteobacteria bacterium]
MMTPLAPGEAQALVRTIMRCPDPVDLFSACGGGSLGTLLLETAEVADASVGGKSLIVTQSALSLRCQGSRVQAQARSGNGRGLLPWLATKLALLGPVTQQGDIVTCEITLPPDASRNEEERLKAPMAISALRSLVFGLQDRLGQPSSTPLMVGVFSYDLLGTFEDLPPASADPLHCPDYEFWLPELSIWLDHQRRSAQIVGHVFCDEGYGDILHGVQQLVSQLETDAIVNARQHEVSQQAPAAELHLDLDDASYGDLVDRVKEHIVAGDVFQIVPSRTFSLPCPDPLRAYRRLRAINPSPYMFYICGQTNEGQASVLFGASPETALKVDGLPRQVQLMPIAGTKPRGRAADGAIDADLDSRYEAALRLDEKEVAEHMMLVDLARNDVARVSEPGTRHVHRLLTIARYSHVMHLVSLVRGTLRADLDALHAYVATMNMGTLVGAPKIKAAQLLRRYEATRRGPYGGAVGYVMSDGRMDTGIVIRSAVVVDGVAYVRAGAGVVYDSDPQAETDETRRKAQAVLTAIQQACGES